MINHALKDNAVKLNIFPNAGVFVVWDANRFWETPRKTVVAVSTTYTELSLSKFTNAENIKKIKKKKKFGKHINENQQINQHNIFISESDYSIWNTTSAIYDVTWVSFQF